MTSNNQETEAHANANGFVMPDLNALPNDPRVDRTLNRYMYALGAYLKNQEDRSRVPGAAVLVRRGSDIVHINCYGYANLETEQKITPTTIFDLGSMSKQFTAAAVLSLFSDGLLNEPISKYFEEFAGPSESITVEQLIHHTSALPEYFAMRASSQKVQDDLYKKAMDRPDDWYPAMASRKKRELSNKDVLRWIAAQKLLDEKPGTEMQYCNSGYVVLAELVERVSKKRFADFAKDVLFQFLEMNDTFVFDENTSFASDAPEVVNHARCYNRVKGKGFVPVGYTPLNFIYGDGNIHSTILDLAKWDFNLQSIDYAAVAAGKESDRNEYQKARDQLWAPVHLKSGKLVNYGAGWNLRAQKYEDDVEENGKQVTKNFDSRAEYHRGVWLGWRCFISRGTRWIIPEAGEDVDPKTWESLGIIVLSNNSQFNVCRIAQHMSHIYWGKLKKDNIMNRFDCR
jgi:CubicO group peptidase (beta-lactamase class C family)